MMGALTHATHIIKAVGCMPAVPVFASCILHMLSEYIEFCILVSAKREE